MPPKVQKSKDAKAKAAAGGGKGKKKKWSKGKARDKLNNLVLFDKSTFEKFEKEVPTYKLITVAILSDRLRINGSLARKALRYMSAKGVIKPVSKHARCGIYTRATAGD